MDVVVGICKRTGGAGDSTTGVAVVAVVECVVVVAMLVETGTSPGATQTVWTTSTVSMTSSKTVNHTISRFSNGTAAVRPRSAERAKMLKDFMVAEGVYAIGIACVDAVWVSLPNECRFD